MHFDIALRYQLLGTISDPLECYYCLLPLPPSPYLLRLAYYTISCLR